MFTIEIIRHIDASQTIIHYHPFAWLSWPIEALFLAWQRISESIRLALTGSCVVMTGGWVKERFVAVGDEKPRDRCRIIKTAVLSPLQTSTRYESRTEYLRAIDVGCSGLPVAHGKFSPVKKPGRQRD